MPARVLFSVPTAAGISYLFFRFAIKGWSVLKGEGEEKKKRKQQRLFHYLGAELSYKCSFRGWPETAADAELLESYTGLGKRTTMII